MLTRRAAAEARSSLADDLHAPDEVSLQSGKADASARRQAERAVQRSSRKAAKETRRRHTPGKQQPPVEDFLQIGRPLVGRVVLLHIGWAPAPSRPAWRQIASSGQ